jgi:hypothetical protein
MLFTILPLGLVLLPFAVAQQIHDVQVGANGLNYTPEAIVSNFLSWICVSHHDHKFAERPTG